MSRGRDWKPDALKILTLAELNACAQRLRYNGRRSVTTRANLVIFRLSCCCGLRASEIAGLRIKDVHLTERMPRIEAPGTITKGGRSRRIPLWWDQDTLEDLTAWLAERRGAHGAKPTDPVVCSLRAGTSGQVLTRHHVAHRFKTALKALPAARRRQLSVHSGRHTFCSQALNGGRDVLEVRDAAGHSSIAMTNVYLHMVPDEGQVGRLFARPDQQSRAPSGPIAGGIPANPEPRSKPDANRKGRPDHRSGSAPRRSEQPAGPRRGRRGPAPRNRVA